MRQKIKFLGHTKGVTLIELLVAMAIGLFLSFAGLAFYSQLKHRVNVVRAEDRLQARARILAAHLEYITKDAGYTGCLTGEDYNQGGILARRDEYQKKGSLTTKNEIDNYYFLGPKRFDIGRGFNSQERYLEFFSVTSLLESRLPVHLQTIPIISARNVDESGWMSVSNYSVPHTSKVYTSEETCEPFRPALTQKEVKELMAKDASLVELYQRIPQTTGYRYIGNSGGKDKNQLFIYHRYNLGDARSHELTMQRLETNVTKFDIQIGIASNSEDPYVREYVSPEKFRLLIDRKYKDSENPELKSTSSPDLKPTYLIRSVKYHFILEDPYGLVKKPIEVTRVVRLNNPRFEDPDKVY